MEKWTMEATKLLIAQICKSVFLVVIIVTAISTIYWFNDQVKAYVAENNRHEIVEGTVKSKEAIERYVGHNVKVYYYIYLEYAGEIYYLSVTPHVYAVVKEESVINVIRYLDNGDLAVPSPLR